MNSAQAISEIQRAVDHRSLRLAFDPTLEAQFEADTGAARCQDIIRQSYLGLVIFNACILRDWLLVPDLLAASVIIHLAVMTPATMALTFIMRSRPAVWLREGLPAAGVVIGTASVLALTIASASPLRSSEHLSVVLVILYATMVQRIRFKYVLVACLVSLGLYVAALAPFGVHNFERMLVADGVLAGVILFALIGCHRLEADVRASYLLSRRDRLRNEALESLSQRDALTGTGNRRALDRAIARVDAASSDANRQPRPHRSVAILLIDIDFFKAFNDRHGHLAGDECLRRVADIIAATAADGADSVFRFGGEEFLVLLENTTLANAGAVAERIRRAVEHASIEHAGATAGRVTVSVGVAAGTLCREVGAADLIADADRALYAAKDDGRNNVKLRAGIDGAAGRRAA